MQVFAPLQLPSSSSATQALRRRRWARCPWGIVRQLDGLKDPALEPPQRESSWMVLRQEQFSARVPDVGIDDVATGGRGEDHVAGARAVRFMAFLVPGEVALERVAGPSAATPVANDRK